MTEQPEKAPAPRRPARYLIPGRSRSDSELEQERDDYLDALQRLKAEFDNFRKRTAREHEAMSARANEALLRELLPILDDLERALEAAEQHEEAKLEDGVRLVHRALADTAPATGSRRSRPTAPSTRTSTRRCSRSPSEKPSRARWSRCSRRATASATACCGRPGSWC